MLVITATFVLSLVACSSDDVTDLVSDPDQGVAGPIFTTDSNPDESVIIDSASDSGDGDSGGMTVIVDVFSGRPNPSFVLAVSEADQLAALAGALVPTGGGDPLAGLGFRGFVVGVGELPPGSVVAPHGVWTPDGTQYKDPDRQMFDYLRDRAVRALGPEMNDR